LEINALNSEEKSLIGLIVEDLDEEDAKAVGAKSTTNAIKCS